MRRLRTVVVVLCMMSVAALAQEEQTMPQAQAPLAPGPYDPPPGFPYNTGTASPASPASGAAAASQVPLRDFLSSRQDHQRAEIIDRLKEVEKQLRQIVDERDKQYAQRFAAQQDAMERALTAAKEAVSAALSSADRAVQKAEAAAEKRFESVNEFRQTLTDQASTFISKDTAEARFSSVEEKLILMSDRINAIGDRLNVMQAKDQGSDSTWVFLIAVASILIALGALAFNVNRSRRERAPE